MALGCAAAWLASGHNGRMHAQPPLVITPASYPGIVAALCQGDALLAALVERWGAPPLWLHPRGFAGLALAILAQQVSLESAHKTYRRLSAAAPGLAPAALLALGEDGLRRLGCSRAKAGYLSGIAADVVAGDLDLATLQALDDGAVRERLLRLRGVGRWTADTYLLFSLAHADAWPTGDLALEKALADAQGAPRALDSAEVNRWAERWRPWRAVAARILWCHYLHERGRFDAVSRAWAELGSGTVG